MPWLMPRAKENLMTRTMLWRRGALGAVTAGALAVGTLGLAPLAIAAPTTTNIHGGDIAAWDAHATPPVAMPGGWFKELDHQAGTPTGEVVADDTEPANHDGSLHLATPAALDKIAVEHGADTSLLSSFVTGSYDAKVIAGTTRATYQLVIDCNGTTTGGSATLNYVGAAQTVADGWKTLDVVAGGNAMWSSTDTLNGDGTTSPGNPQPTGANGVQSGTPATLIAIKAACASGTVSTYGVNMGSGSAGLDGSVDSVNFNDAVTNFERVSVDRMAGANRVETAVEVSKALFDDVGGLNTASAVVLASSEGFADGVSGGPLAASVGGPLLLTKGSSLDPATGAEITRILAKGGTVDVLGGVGAISDNVSTSLTGLGFSVTRLQGADRYGTAVAVADSMPGSKTVLLTSGAVFPDALSAGPAAAHAGGVVLLTKGATMPSATQEYLTAHPSDEVFAIGGDAAKAAPTTAADHQLVGVDRYETGTKVAAHFFSHPGLLTFASGENFPDALSGGAFASLIDSPILLVRSALVPAFVTTYLKANETTVSHSALIGGAAVVSDTVATSLEGTLNGF
jgi:putative cell wall-binding protein